MPFDPAPPAASAAAHARAWAWRTASHGVGPFVGAARLASELRARRPGASAEAWLEALVAGERRKHMASAAAMAVLSTVALPAGLPASIAVAALLDARAALCVAHLLGHDPSTAAVRAALEAAVDSASPLAAFGWGRGLGQTATAAGTAFGWRTAVQQLAPAALRRGRELLGKRVSQTWARRLLPVARGLPIVGNAAMAALDARNIGLLVEDARRRLAELSSPGERPAPVRRRRRPSTFRPTR